MIEWRKVTALAALLICFGICSARAQADYDQAIYSGQLTNGWESWSWCYFDFGNTQVPAPSGNESIYVGFGAYSGLWFEHGPFDPTLYTNISFWINGGAGGQQLTLEASFTVGLANGVLDTNDVIAIGPLATNVWEQYSFPLSMLAAATNANLDGFILINGTGGDLPAMYVADVKLIAGLPPAPTTNVLVIDAAANAHPISSLIYGVAETDSNTLSDLNLTANRSGGNEDGSTYNWADGVHGKGQDWYFEAIPDDSPNPGYSTDEFISNSVAGGAQPLVSIPMIGWSPKLGTNRSIIWSYSIAKYGPQEYFSPNVGESDAGNGFSTTNNSPITWNDPNDAYFPVGTNFQAGYLKHLIGLWGKSDKGGVPFYIMDNEHSLWHATHQDIHPQGATMQEVLSKIVDYASLVKSMDPSAKVLAPEEWGWEGYLYSGYDQQNPGRADRAANGGWDYMPWLLNQLYQHDTATGQRLLDYFTLHCYPQGGEDSDDVTVPTELLRNRSTRQLWDTNYVDDSWQEANIQLIPRMKNWVSANYPGTKIGVTEYNWGADDSMNGATTQADILGIFGRESLDLATRWGTPSNTTPTYEAFKMYRNYDGKKSTFGDTSVSALPQNPDNVSVFAAKRSVDGALTIMVVSKYLSGTVPLTMTITNFSATGVAQVWQLNSNNPSSIQRLADISYAGQALNASVPGPSVTLYVISTNSPAPRITSGALSGNRMVFSGLDGPARGANHTPYSYYVLTSSNLALPLAKWTPIATNTFNADGTFSFTNQVNASSQAQFFTIAVP